MVQAEVQASLLNLPAREVVLASAGEIGGFLRASEYDKLQYTPVPTLGTIRFDNLAASGLIGSFRESWVHDTSAVQQAYQGVWMEPSITYIERLERRLPAQYSDIATVVRPDWQQLGSDGGSPSRPALYARLRQSGALRTLLHQPTVDLLAAWGLTHMVGDEAADTMIVEQSQHGFDGIALDLHLLTAGRGDRQRSPDWVDAFVARLAARRALDGKNEVLVSLRPKDGDEPGDIEKVMGGGFSTTRVGELLGIVRENLSPKQSRLRVTVEVPAQAFDEAGGYEMGNQVVCAAVRQVITAT